MTTILKGIAASSGISIAKTFYFGHQELDTSEKKITDIPAEVERFNEKLESTKQELISLKEKTLQKLGADKAAVFEAHLLILEDPEYISAVISKIESDSVNAEFAVFEVSSMFEAMFEAMDNEYMKERAADIRDISKRLLSQLLNIQMISPADIDEEVIIVAEDLTPSDTAQLNPEFVLGFVTNIGGRTSHSAIMARSLGIPAVVGTKNVTELAKNGDVIILDAVDGAALINPSENEISFYKEKKNTYLEKLELQKKLVNLPTVSKDNVHVELAANIGTPSDLKKVLENGAEGIGLFRTEFLYMDREDLPSEEEQFEAYKAVLEGMGEKPVVIRTLDVGGDKELPYLNLPKEMNPFLGFRALRFCLENTDVFTSQLRALLRASIYGNLKVMFPMVATVDEFRRAKTLFLEVKESLLLEGVAVSEKIELGIMVEIPSTAVLADVFAKEVDFFSIGTNDLIQYTMAADRMNEKVSYLYQPYNPSILRLVKMVIDAAHKEGKWAGMCGEMAGDLTAIPILLALGLDEFSMSATSILPARELIMDLDKKELEGHLDTILSFSGNDEVEAYVNKLLKK